jgi:hypothetical protein
VTFAQAPALLNTRIKQIYGIYTVLPQETAIVVMADFRLLGSFAGALIGLPDSAVAEHLMVTPMEELLSDAIKEVLNVAKDALATDGRAVFANMVTNPIYIDGAAQDAIQKPGHRSYFNVSVDDYHGGRFTIFSQFAKHHDLNS